jgi:hypothetical protein
MNQNLKTDLVMMMAARNINEVNEKFAGIIEIMR